MAKYRTLRPNVQPVPSAPTRVPAAPSYPRRPPGRPIPVRPRRPPRPALPAPPRPPRQGPLFEPFQPKRLPFGRRPPKEFERPFVRRLPRLPWVKYLPWVGPAMLTWEIAERYFNSTPYIDDEMLRAAGYSLCCSYPGFTLNAYARQSSASQTACALGGLQNYCGLSGQLTDGSWPASLGAHADSLRILLLGEYNAPRTRMTIGQIWHNPDWSNPTWKPIPAITPKPGGPIVNIPDEWVPPLPDWLYPPRPFGPQPIPVAPPLTFPDPLPSPEAPAVPPPAPRPPIMPAPVPGVVPAINWSPGGFLEPGDHIKRRPDPTTERERKKRLGPSATWKWYKFIERVGGLYMEFDDNVAALYKGLHWSVRRWRGRDGVWRDRDIKSVARMERIFQYAATVKFSVTDALMELAKEQASDWAFGKIGNAIKKKTTENANNGWWAGARGPSSQPQDNQWSEAYKELQRQKYQRNKKLRKYTSWREAQNGQWVRVVRRRPDTQIPWFKQDSLYPAPLRLRGNQLKGGFARRYYAPRATQRPRTIKGLR